MARRRKGSQGDSASGGGDVPAGTIPPGEIVNFIVKVRYMSSQTTDPQRWLTQIKNLANYMFRSYVGYTARGEYRLKAKGERVFADEVAQIGGADPFAHVRMENERLKHVQWQMERILEEREEFEKRKRDATAPDYEPDGDLAAPKDEPDEDAAAPDRVESDEGDADRESGGEAAPEGGVEESEPAGEEPDRP